MTESKSKPVSKTASKPILSGDKVKVTNISSKILNLASGTVDPNKDGIATVAELQCFHKYLKAK